jgi:hypothetical protein
MMRNVNIISDNRRARCFSCGNLLLSVTATNPHITKSMQKAIAEMSVARRKIYQVLKYNLPNMSEFNTMLTGSITHSRTM